MNAGGQPTVTSRNQLVCKIRELRGDTVWQINQMDAKSGYSAHGDSASSMRSCYEDHARDIIPWFKDYGAPR